MVVAASPLGSRYAATKSRAKKSPMVSTPRTAARHHHDPWGRRRVSASSRSPAGSARTHAEKSGRPSGSQSWVTA